MDAVRIRAIEVIPGKTSTSEAHLDLPVIDGKLESDLSQDVLKTFVFERHHETGTVGVGFTKGFGITRGAMASTVAHDAHNLLVLGTNDDDMALATNTLIECGGGQVVVADSQVLALVELPIAGLMSPLDAPTMSKQVHALEKSMGRNWLHHAFAFHDNGAYSACVFAGITSDKSRFGGLHHLPVCAT